MGKGKTALSRFGGRIPFESRQIHLIERCTLLFEELRTIVDTALCDDLAHVTNRHGLLLEMAIRITAGGGTPWADEETSKAGGSGL
jgi:hypothetical protein